MGWLKIGHRQDSKLRRDEGPLEGVTEHDETKYPLCDPCLPLEHLPFLDAAEVNQHRDQYSNGPWIVIDNTVFDCSDFVRQHPGGEEVINSFGGEECSWQFWRFHGKKEMEEFGLKLRIGRTEGLVNRYKEPVKYVGLRKLGVDDW